MRDISRQAPQREFNGFNNNGGSGGNVIRKVMQNNASAVQKTLRPPFRLHAEIATLILMMSLAFFPARWNCADRQVSLSQRLLRSRGGRPPRIDELKGLQKLLGNFHVTFGASPFEYM
ncbi:hypothetical protein QQF51_01315 [Brucella intermedia]|nr:hypothetical protein [Brucella intermedia]MDL2201296.1 hypothetical protein [Brucella intermedia]